MNGWGCAKALSPESMIGSSWQWCDYTHFTDRENQDLEQWSCLLARITLLWEEEPGFKPTLETLSRTILGCISNSCCSHTNWNFIAPGKLALWGKVRKMTSQGFGGLEPRGGGKKNRCSRTACAKVSIQGKTKCFNLAPACWEGIIRIRMVGSRSSGCPGPRIYS